MGKERYGLIPDALEYCALGADCGGCPLTQTRAVDWREACISAFREAAWMIRALRADLERERGARMIVDEALRQQVKENQELKERCAALKDQYDPEVVQMLDGERMRSITGAALLELLRAWDEDRIAVLPAEEGPV